MEVRLCPQFYMHYVLGGDGENGPLAHDFWNNHSTAKLDDSDPVVSNSFLQSLFFLLISCLFCRSTLFSPGFSLTLVPVWGSWRWSQPELPTGRSGWMCQLGHMVWSRWNKKKRAKADTSTELAAQITQQLFSNLVIAGKVTAESRWCFDFKAQSL